MKTSRGPIYKCRRGTDAKSSCANCVFTRNDGKYCVKPRELGPCRATEREDKKNVFFEKLCRKFYDIDGSVINI